MTGSTMTSTRLRPASFHFSCPPMHRPSIISGAASFLQKTPPRSARATITAVIFCACVSETAHGHTGTGLPGGFESGFEHPLSGADHLLAMVSVGIWGAFLGRPLIYALPVIFPLMMVVGAILGMIGAPILPVEIGIAVSVVVLGLCVCLAIKAAVWPACAIVAMFALFHGYAHGAELPSAADPVGYSLGFVVATGLLHVCGIGVGALNSYRHGAFVTRALGAAITSAGVWYLCRALNR
jgi:urease accessory protein